MAEHSSMNSDPRIDGVALPVQTNTRYYWIETVKGTQGVRYVVLGRKPYARYTHWMGRPIPCNERPDCPWCGRGLGIRYTAWVAAIRVSTKKLVCLTLSEGAVKAIMSRWEDGPGLRGLDVFLKRTVDGPQKELLVEFNNRCDPGAERPEFDVIPSLHRLWNIQQRQAWEDMTGQHDGPGGAGGAVLAGPNRPRPALPDRHAVPY